jgi:kinesin family protein 1
MIAAISPADYDETLSTLRYADQAKKIQNKAVVNEDPNAKMIRELKEELSTLRDRLMVYAPEVVEELNSSSAYKPTKQPGNQQDGSVTPIPTRSVITNANQVLEIVDEKGEKKKMTKQQIVDQLASSEKLLANLNETWEDKMKKTEHIHQEREQALKELGITIDKNEMGIYTPKSMPFIVNLNEDPLMSECLMYQIKTGKTRIGRQDGSSQCEIRLSGSNIQDEHCWIEYDNGTVTLYPNTKLDAMTMVNGNLIDTPHVLKTGYRIILGHHHIFRFNNPEEVRRERNDLMRQATASACTNRSDDDESAEVAAVTNGSADVMDWNYARLEAMRNQYASEANFSGLKDDEIEKLYDDIGRIRQSRKSRADSRLDDYDDNDSSASTHRLSAAVTLFEDGSVCTDATLVSQNEKIQEKIKDVKKKHQKELESQRSFYEAKLSHMSSMQFGMDSYSPHQVKLIRRVIDRWKRLHYVTMAEVVLTHAVLLKEANIISRELSKDVTYQFSVIEEGFTQLQSYWEEMGTLQQYDDESDDDDLISSTKPCIGIRVLDRKNQCVYVWSIDKLKTRLNKMRNLRQYVDRPQYRKHFNWEDPFYESPSPKYSFIGSAAVSIRNLQHHQAFESTVDVRCRTTGQIKGQLRLLVSPIARSGQSEERHDMVLQLGQQLLFEVRLLELTGINETDFTGVHVQFRLSSFGAPRTSAEKLFATDPSRGFGTGSISLDYSQTLSVVVTQALLDTLNHGNVVFEVYGMAQSRVLAQYERWDDQREKPQLSELMAPPKNTILNAPLCSSPTEIHVERRPEEELLAAERHDVLAWVQIGELMPNGNYTPVQVVSQTSLDRGAFTLRQGLQRRITITLSHTSGRQFVWNKISKATIGQVRLLDSKGRIITSPAHEDIEIRMLSQQQIHYKNDGTSQLIAQGAWDSSQHDCLFLNRLTAANTRILLNLKWEIEVEKCSKPITCQMDIAVRIQGRDASSFGLRKLLGSSKYMNKCSSVFLIHLRPPMTRRVSQLWRLNTASKTIPGEELLGSWRPRGVSLVTDHRHIKERIERREQVTAIAQLLMLRTARSQTSHGSMSESPINSEISSGKQTELVQKVLKLWRSQWGTSKEVKITFITRRRFNN